MELTPLERLSLQFGNDDEELTPLERMLRDLERGTGIERPRRDLSLLGADIRAAGGLRTEQVTPELMHGPDTSGTLARHGRAFVAGLGDVASVVPGAVELTYSVANGIADAVPDTGIESLDSLVDRASAFSGEMEAQAGDLRRNIREASDEIAPASNGVIADLREREGLGGKISALTEGVARGLPSTLASLATGGGAGAVAVGAALEGIPAYGEARDEGVGKFRSLVGATGTGAVSGLLDRLGIESIIGDKEMTASLLKSIRQAALKEGGTEALQEVNAYIWEKFQGRDGGNVIERAAGAGLVGGLTGGGLRAAVGNAQSTAEMIAEARELESDLGSAVDKGFNEGASIAKREAGEMQGESIDRQAEMDWLHKASAERDEERSRQTDWFNRRMAVNNDQYDQQVEAEERSKREAAELEAARKDWFDRRMQEAILKKSRADYISNWQAIKSEHDAELQLAELQVQAEGTRLYDGGKHDIPSPMPPQIVVNPWDMDDPWTPALTLREAHRKRVAAINEKWHQVYRKAAETSGSTVAAGLADAAADAAIISTFGPTAIDRVPPIEEMAQGGEFVPHRAPGDGKRLFSQLPSEGAAGDSFLTGIVRKLEQHPRLEPIIGRARDLYWAASDSLKPTPDYTEERFSRFVSEQGIDEDELRFNYNAVRRQFEQFDRGSATPLDKGEEPITTENGQYKVFDRSFNTLAEARGYQLHLKDTPHGPVVDSLKEIGFKVGATQPSRIGAAQFRALPAEGLSGSSHGLRLSARKPKPEYPNDVDVTDTLDIEDGKSIADRALDFAKATYREFFNREAALEWIGKRVGDQRLAQMVALARGASDIARYPINRGTRLYRKAISGYVLTGKGLRQELGGIDREQAQDLSRWMAADRQLELADRAAEIQERFEADKAEYRLAISVAKEAKRKVLTKAATRSERKGNMRAYDAARKAIPPRPSLRKMIAVDEAATQRARDTRELIAQKWGDRLPELEDMSERVRQWSRRAILAPLVEVGYLSRERYRAILDSNEKYAPFFRLIEDLDGELSSEVKGNTKNPLHRISKDISAGIINPLEAFVLKAQQVQHWVTRQRIRNHLADLAETHPDAIPEVRRVGTKNAPTLFERNDQFAVYKKGERYTYQASSDVLAALESLTPVQSDLLMKSLTFFASLRRTGATLGLGFIFRNPFRDQQTAAVNSEYGYKPYVDLVKGLFAMSPWAKRLTPHLSQFYDEALAVGGTISDQHSSDMKGAALQLDSVLTERGAAGAYKKLREVVRADGFLAPLQMLSKTLEMGTRVGAYANARQAGANQMQAGVEMRDITIDFRRYGNTGQKWNLVEAFVNAELQDFDKFVRNFKNRPAATAIKAVAYITVPSLVNYAINRDDEDYAKLHDWDRMLFYHVHKFEDGSFFRLPRPMGMLNVVFGWGVEKALEYTATKDPEAVAAFLNSFVEQTPLHFAASKGIDNYTPFNPENYLDLVPTAAEPLTEAAFNFDTFRNSPIVPEGEKDLLPEFQGQDTLGPSMLKASQLTGVSPYVAQHMIQGYGATLGRNAIQLADSVMGEPGEAAPPDPHAVSSFLGFRSKKPIGFGSKAVNDFYSLADRAHKVAETIKLLKEKGNAGALLQLAAANPEYRFDDMLKKTRARLAKLRAARREFIATPGLSPDQRAAGLNDIDYAATQLAGATTLTINQLLGLQEGQQ